MATRVVCTHCQLLFLRPYLSRHTSSARHISHSTFLLDHDPSPGTTAAASQQQQSLEESPTSSRAPSDPGVNSRIIRRVPGRDGRWQKKSSQPPPPWYGYHKGRRVLMNSEAIGGMEILGEPARAIIMRDNKRKMQTQNTRHNKGRLVVDEDEQGTQGGAVDTVTAAEDTADADADAYEDTQSGGDMADTPDVSRVASVDEAQSNIEALRPPHGEILPRVEFDRMTRTLCEGFTAAQLALYVQNFRPGRDIASPITHNSSTTHSSSFSPITHNSSSKDPQHMPYYITPWTPEVANDALVSAAAASAASATDRSLIGYYLRGMTNKQRLAIRIMRLCWAIEMQEILCGPGLLVLSLQHDYEVDVLALKNQQFLASVRERSMGGGGPRDSIQLLVDKQPGLDKNSHRDIKREVRIRAPRATAEAVAAEIMAAISGLLVETLAIVDDGVNVFPPALLQPESLRELGAITNTVLRFSNDKKTNGELQVISLPPLEIEKKTNSTNETETPKETVFRLLMSAVPHTTSESRDLHILGTITTTTTRKGCFYLLLQDAEQHQRKQQRSWHLRHGHFWGRYTAPLLQTSPSSSSSSSRSSHLAMPSVVGLPWPVAEPSSSSSSSVAGADGVQDSWAPAPLVSTSATFGQIWHTMPSQTTSTVTPDAPPTNERTRFLAPSMLPLSCLAQPSAAGLPSITDPTASPSSSIIMIRLVPNPKDPHAATAPVLEIRLDKNINIDGSSPSSSNNSTQKIESISIRAVTQTHISDVLLPTRPIDVRIAQARYYPWRSQSPATDFASLPSPIPVFLEQSSLNASQGRLATPAHVQQVPLPARLFTPAPEVHEQRPFSSYSSSSSTTITVDYMFAGLELQEAIESSFQGWRLTYTSIEAGQGGGQRAEITLHDVPTSPTAANASPAASSSSSSSSPAMTTSPLGSAANTISSSSSPSSEQQQPQPPRPQEAVPFLKAVADLAAGERIQWQLQEQASGT